MSLRLAALVLVVGCASDPSGIHVDGRVTLTGEVGNSQGFDLATRTIVTADSTPSGEPGGCEVDRCDFFLSITMVAYLFGPHLFESEVEQSFCHRGVFSRVEDIPTDIAGCDWSFAGLGGNADQGYLVRDRRHERLYRLLVVEDNVSIFVGEGSVSFDVAPAGDAAPTR